MVIDRTCRRKGKESIYLALKQNMYLTYVGKMIKSSKIKKLNPHYRHICKCLKRLFLYSLVAISCVVLCTSPLWFPSLCLWFKSFLFISLPRFISLFLTPKSLFLIGNLIVLFLVGESKILCRSSDSLKTVQTDDTLSFEKCSELEIERIVLCKSGDEEDDCCCEKPGKKILSLKDEELKKRADEFIAKVNKQFRVEYHGDLQF